MATFSLFHKYRKELIPDELPFQAKVLKYTCLILLISSFAGLLVNAFLGFPLQLNLVISAFILFVTWLFIKMPVHSHYNRTGSMLVCAELMTLAVNWFPNGGLFSSTPYFFLLLIGFSAVTLTGLYLWGTVTICLFVFSSLVTLEAYKPQWLEPLELDSWSLKVDIMISILFLGYLLTGFISGIIKKNRERYLQVEEASQAKSMFLSQLSHELRTPLNSVIGFSNILRKEALSEKDQLLLERINVNGLHLLALVNQVLDLSMIESGKVALEFKEVNLIKLLQEIEDVIVLDAQEKDLSYIFETPSTHNSPYWVRTDPNRLRQVLVNIANNAIKYTEKGQVSCRLYKESNALHIDIEDTGSGIPTDKQTLIFAPLFRLEKHHQHEGKGMGLSISYSLCKHLKYSLELVRSSSTGSLFRVVIPYTEADVITMQNNRSSEVLKQ